MEKLTVEMIQQGGHTYKACKQLIEGIQLCGDNKIRTCPCAGDESVMNIKKDTHVVLSHESPTFTSTMDIGNEFNKDFFENIYQEKLKWILAINNGEEHFCNNCGYLQENTWGAVPKLRLTRLFFSHSWACNCNCTYCHQDHAAPPNKRVVEFLIKARDLGYLFDNRILEVGFAGGEPILLPDFEGLFEYTKNARDAHSILTSGVKFSDNIAKLLANPVAPKTYMCISIDAGTAEIYRKIKRVDQFDRVVGNINKYYGAAANKKAIEIKYLMLEQNCSKENLDTFIKLIRTNGWHDAIFVITNNRFVVSNEEYQAVLNGVEYLTEQLTKLTKKSPHVVVWKNE